MEQPPINPDEGLGIGWAALDAALAKVYPQGPIHQLASFPSAMLGGENPLSGISVYRRDAPTPHWHLVTYGYTELLEKETKNPDLNGYGFEMTFRLACPAGEESLPNWAPTMLMQIAKYVFKTGNVISPREYMDGGGPLGMDPRTELSALLFVEDPELQAYSCEFGKARFVQVLGITKDELREVIRCGGQPVLDELKALSPLWITDTLRKSILGDPVIANRLGTVPPLGGKGPRPFNVETMMISSDHKQVTIRTRVRVATTIADMVSSAYADGDGVMFISREASLHIRAGSPSIETVGKTTTIFLDRPSAQVLVSMLRRGLGTHNTPEGFPLSLRLEVLS